MDPQNVTHLMAMKRPEMAGITDFPLQYSPVVTLASFSGSSKRGAYRTQARRAGQAAVPLCTPAVSKWVHNHVCPCLLLPLGK